MTETFPIIPAQVRVMWIFLPLLLVLVGAVAAVGYSFAGARSARFDVSSAGLRLRGDFYGRLIPWQALQLDAVRAVDLRAEPLLMPVRRTFGTGMPGYRAGWFRLRDGERALVYLTDPSRVVYVPTREGYAVLLSVADPQALLAALLANGYRQSPGAGTGN